MAAINEDEARGVLSREFGIGESVPAFSCRINFFDAGYLALPAGSVAIVRQDMLGRVHSSLIPQEEIVGVFVSQERGRRRSVRFGWQDGSWRIDQVPEGDWRQLMNHLGLTEDGEQTSLREKMWVVEVDAGQAAGNVEEADQGELGEITGMVVDSPPRSISAAYKRAEEDSFEVLSEDDLEEITEEPARPVRVVAAQGPPPTVAETVARLAAAEAAQIVAPLQRLCKICLDSDDEPRALMAARALKVLGATGVLEERLLEGFPIPTRLPQTKIALTSDAWAVLTALAPGDLRLADVVESIAPALIRMTARPKKAFGLGPMMEGADDLVFARMFRYVQQLLSLPEAEFYPEADRPIGMQLASVVHSGTWIPTIVVGRDLLANKSERELAFRVAREMTYLRRSLVMSALVPDLSQQALVMLTCVALVEPEHPLLGDREAINNQMKHLSAHMTLDDFETVGSAVRNMLAATEPFDLARFNLAVEVASLRVGLLVCGDFSVVAEAIKPEPGEERKRYDWLLGELIKYSLQDPFQALVKTMAS